MAQIVAFRARDSRARFECLRHAVEARRLQDVVVERNRSELMVLGLQVASEVDAMTPRQRRERLDELDRRLVRSLRESNVFPPTSPECA